MISGIYVNLFGGIRNFDENSLCHLASGEPRGVKGSPRSFLRLPKVSFILYVSIQKLLCALMEVYVAQM